jgi:hypothetical protein
MVGEPDQKRVSETILMPWIVAAALGVIVVCLPFYGSPPHPMDAPLFPWVRTGVEKLGPINVVLLFISGGVVGALFGRHPWRAFLLGLATMTAFPFFAVAEMIVDPTSHNLWPIEFLIYFVLGLIAGAGALVGWFTASWRLS